MGCGRKSFKVPISGEATNLATSEAKRPLPLPPVSSADELLRSFLAIVAEAELCKPESSPPGSLVSLASLAVCDPLLRSESRAETGGALSKAETRPELPEPPEPARLGALRAVSLLLPSFLSGELDV